MAALRRCGETELYGWDQRHSAMGDGRDGLPVAPLTLRAVDGQALDWAETRIDHV